MVWQVLEMVASGIGWKAIIEQFHGSIIKEAISEAVSLAGKAFSEHAKEYAQESSAP